MTNHQMAERGTNAAQLGFLVLDNLREDKSMKHLNTTRYMLATAMAMLATGCATVEETIAEAVAETRRATLTGSQVVGSMGDPDGTARAELTISDEADQICYDINEIRNLNMITGITINRGNAGSNGPVALRLSQPNEGGWKNCVKRSEWLEERIENNPSLYHVIIYTSDYRNGAVRGQFSAN